MKVIATKLGYYGDKRRREDDVFFLKNEKDFSSKWMKKFEEGEDPQKYNKPKKLKQSDLNEEVI